MRKTLILAAAAAFLFGTGPAWAGNFSLFGSWLDTDDLDESVGGGVATSFALGMEALELELRATYFPDLTENLGDFIDDPGFDRENDIEAIPLDIGLKYTFNPQVAVNPYISGGGTYFILDADRGELDDEVGYYLAGGLEWFRPAGNWGWFAEALWRDAEGTVERDPDDLEDIGDIGDIQELLEDDLDIGGFGVNAGVIWRW